jgi:dCMP deaminase
MNPINTTRLTEWAIGLAQHVALLSKDPSTKVGAVIFDPKRRLVSAGYNGFARGVEDSAERLADRAVKYRMTRHAEANALAFATAPTDGCTMVVTHPCCAQCAGAAIQAGISTVIYPAPDAGMAERWADDMACAAQMFREAGVSVIQLEGVAS